MSFDIDEVMQVLKIIRECKDTELHIETGDLKLSLTKGNVRSSGAGFFSPGAPAQSPAPAVPVAAPQPVEAPAAPVAQPQKAASDKPDQKPKAEADVASEEGLVPVIANVTSVFYRKPNPEEPPFVEVGDRVEEDTVVCLLEVMKCYRQVMAGTRGVVQKICAESNHLVEQGAVLFLIRPE